MTLPAFHQFVMTELRHRQQLLSKHMVPLLCWSIGTIENQNKINLWRHRRGCSAKCVLFIKGIKHGDSTPARHGTVQAVIYTPVSRPPRVTLHSSVYQANNKEFADHSLLVSLDTTGPHLQNDWRGMLDNLLYRQYIILHFDVVV